MNPLTANKSVLNHPVVAQRLKTKRLVKLDKEKVRFTYRITCCFRMYSKKKCIKIINDFCIQ